MALTFSLDVGNTSIGFAVIDYDVERAVGKIRCLGVRIFPAIRDLKGVQLNQKRRQARLRCRQLRLRRRQKRHRMTGDLLCYAGLFLARDSDEWCRAMQRDPYSLRRQVFEWEILSSHKVGRAITLPDREQPTGEVFDRLQTSTDREESRYVASLRNPTSVRTLSRLRRVINNLIDIFGKPDLIRVEFAHDVENSKR